MSYSWETRSATSSSASAAPVTTAGGAAWGKRTGTKAQALAVRAPRPELIGLVVLAAILNLWALSRNGWANTYYAAAVRSMSSSWHNFLFASLDPSGVMTVDKPPLALWVQALSVRIFGYDSLSILVPQALMGVGSVVLLYDLVRRRFGRLGGFVGGLALAVTPITVAISRHNNPDALLVLCCVGALWCTVRALESGRTRWLVGAGVLVGLGFETKMGVALTVVPGIVLAWLWISPAGRGRLHALGQLLWGGAAMVIVGGAWPALVQLTPAGDRPWISGTSDNSVFSLMFEYNGLGRVDGQSGGPGGAGGGNVFGGSTGPFRLLNSALGGQAGWLLGFAIVAGLAILAGSRLRRADKGSGWLIAVGGAFLTTAVLFSVASGIFHPYYVSLLAPFAAALVGAGAAQLLEGGLLTRVFAPLAVAGGVITELVVRGDYPGQLSWLPSVLIVVGVLAAIALVAFKERIVRLAALGGALAALLIAPTAWAFDTLGYATSSTFPAGGPASAESMGGPGGGFGGAGRRLGGNNFGGAGAGGSAPQLFGTGASSSSTGAPEGGVPTGQQGGPPKGAGSAAGEGPPGGLAGFAGGPGRGGFAGAAAGGGGAPGGAFGGGESLKSVLSYVTEHGGGTVAVSSQSSAATAIISSGARVAGIGGFSGRESDVSVSWLAMEVSLGKIRWVVGESSAGATGGAASRGTGGGGFGGGLPGDTRTGSKTAMAAVAKACTKVTLPSTSSTSGGTLYDCQGRSAQLAKA
jgi:4-amino-4-deoxy-L-arabinose transferase-like glycosyltransferase